MSPEAHLVLIEAELALFVSHPLSTRQARLVAALLDVMPDRVYAARRESAGSILFATDRADYRRKVLAASPAMALIAALAEGQARLATIAYRVPAEAVEQMDVRDFMVSLYNDQTVPRLVLERDGEQTLATELFAQAAAFWGDARAA